MSITVWRVGRPARHTVQRQRKSEDRPPSPVCALVGKALRAAHPPWETIDRVVLHVGDHEVNRRIRRHFHVRRDQLVDVGASFDHPTGVGLLIGLKDVLERDPEPGTRVLLISFDSDHHGSAGVLEV
ncbi:hypothetical protein ACWGR4_22500 [Embleya sp. NPDC055664]